MNNKNEFDRRQLITLATVMMLVPTLRLFPYGAARLAGHAAWLSAIAALPLLLLYTYFITKLMELRNEGEGLAELIRGAFGAKAGKIVLVISSLWPLLYCAFSLRASAERFITTTFPTASPGVFIVVMGLVGLVAALGSARTLVRTARLVAPFVLGTLLLILAVSLVKVDTDNLVPVTTRDILPVFKGSTAAVDIVCVSLYGVCFLEGAMPKEKGHFKSFAIWCGEMALLLSVISLCILGSFGAELTVKLTHPFFSLVRNLVFFRTLERIEAFVVMLWVFPDFLLLSVFLFASQYSLRLALTGQSSLSGGSLTNMSGGRWLIIVCAAAAIAGALFMAPNSKLLELWSQAIIPLVNLAYAFVFLPIVYFAARHRAKKNVRPA